MKCLHRLCAAVCFLLFAMPAGAVEAVVNFAVFHRPASSGDSAFLEVYWQINPASLHYRKGADGLLTAAVQTNLRVLQGTTIVQDEKYVLQTRPMAGGEAARQPILELHRYYLPAGSYGIALQLLETGFPTGAFLFRDSVRVPGGTPTWYSTLQLIDTVYRGNTPGPFLKNGQQQVPKMVNFLDEGQRQLHYYLELYHTESLPADRFPLVQRVYVSKKGMDLPAFRLQQVDTLREGSPRMPFGNTFSTSVLPSGNYYLQAELQDRNGQTVARQATFFQTVNQQPAELAALPASDSGNAAGGEPMKVFDLSKTFTAKYDASQLRAILKMILPVADPVEAAAINAFLKKPDELYTRYFIYNYFNKRNPKNPEAAWKEFSDVVREVNRQFKSGSTMGYETDRGIVYLKYGKPDERVPVPNESGALPYEIWRYNIAGKVGQNGTFLFYQPGRVGGDFQLLHSTVPGERRNDAWRSALYFTGQSSGNGNSRAEQYIGNR